MTAGVSTHIEGKTEKTYGLKGKRMRTHAGLKNVWEKMRFPLCLQVVRNLAIIYNAVP